MVKLYPNACNAADVFRAQCLSCGWQPVAVRTADKVPVSSGWPSIRGALPKATDAALSTGINASGLRAIDIDVEDPATVSAILDTIHEVAGPVNPLLRRRKTSARCLLVYRAPPGTTPGKAKVTLAAGAVEILGHGQQFVADGLHKDRQDVYEWVAGSPANTPIDKVPVLKAADETALLARLLDEFGPPETAPAPLPDASRLAPSPAPRPMASPPGPGSGFFRAVNDAALANIGAWVGDLFPSARPQPGTGAWRVSSRDLGRGLEEDLSIAPNGIVDFGVHDMGDARGGARTAIDLFVEWDGETPANAALRLCRLMGIDPAALGWQGTPDASMRRADGAAIPGRVTDWQSAPPANDAGRKAPVAAPAFRTEPFTLRDPSCIPPRDWVYGRTHIRKFVTVTAAVGGVGKTQLGITEALAMVTGRTLIRAEPEGPLRVWLFNAEDPYDELERRIAATCLHYGIEPEDIAGRLFVDSGRDTPLVTAIEGRDGVAIQAPVVEAVIAHVRALQIDVIKIDPFVSTHSVNENDNMAIDIVAKEWGRIAGATNTAIELVHHVRKTGGVEATVEDMRGAGALLAAARVGRVLNTMGKNEAENWKVDNRRLHFRVDNGKANMAPPPEAAEWFKLVSVDLENRPAHHFGESDRVGVVTTWEPPEATPPLEGMTARDLLTVQIAMGGARWVASPQSPKWVGYCIAATLKLPLEMKADRDRIRGMIHAWVASGALKVVRERNDRREEQDFIVVGELAT